MSILFEVKCDICGFKSHETMETMETMENAFTSVSVKGGRVIPRTNGEVRQHICLDCIDIVNASLATRIGKHN